MVYISSNMLNKSSLVQETLVSGPIVSRLCVSKEPVRSKVASPELKARCVTRERSGEERKEPLESREMASLDSIVDECKGRKTSSQ